ncbi:MAG: hypothetical protein PHY42_07130 [Bacilli bacterium]|nr:hypothetical protein [Bacilli bacterium]
METEKIITRSGVPPKIITKRAENFREVTQDRVFIGIKEGYFIYIIQNEVFDTNQPEDVEEHLIDEVQVKLSPQQMVKMHKVMGQLIEKYEQIYGEIKTLEQIAIEKPDLVKDTSTKSDVPSN